MHIPLQFHPRFITFSIPGKGVYAISELDCFFLTEKSYPFIQSRFDKQKSNSQALNFSAYNSQVYGLIKNNILCHTTDEHKYVTPTSIKMVRHTFEYWDLVNYSCAHEYWKNQWIELVHSVYKKHKNAPNLTVIFTDDFLTPSISDQFSNDNLNCVIKITGENYWISPLFFGSKRENFNKLCQRIENNQSVKKFFQRQGVNESYQYFPFEQKSKLGQKQEQLIAHCLASMIDDSRSTLAVINSQKNTIDHHPGLLPLTDKNNGNTVKVQLNDSSSQFSEDGGSRIVHPSDTVERISSYVSPISGLITYFTSIGAETNSSITIYKTAFSTTPYPETDEYSIEDSYLQICLGKGITKEQSQASALSEALERQAALFDDQDIKEFTLASPQEIEGRYYLFNQLHHLSDYQYDHYRAEYENSSADLRTLRYDNTPIYWKKIWSLTHSNEVQIPAVKCYKYTPLLDSKFGRWNSNGCASGNSVEEAVLQGLFELIERDASAIWWYNQISRASYNLDQIPDKHREIFEQTFSDKYEYWVLDITSDLGIPVMVAVCKDKKTQQMCFGFGCHLQPVLAAQRALTELCQILAIKHKNSAVFDFNNFYESEFLCPNASAAPAEYKIQSTGNFKTDINAIVQALSECNIETLVLNYNRKESPLCCVKVFTPGLCHIWPEFGNERLYTVPLKMSWLEECNTENSLNPTPLLI